MPPDKAMHNLAAWATWVGLPSLAPQLSRGWVDPWAARTAFVLLALYAALWATFHTRFGRVHSAKSLVRLAAFLDPQSVATQGTSAFGVPVRVFKERRSLLESAYSYCEGFESWARRMPFPRSPSSDGYYPTSPVSLSAFERFARMDMQEIRSLQRDIESAVREASSVYRVIYETFRRMNVTSQKDAELLEQHRGAVGNVLSIVERLKDYIEKEVSKLDG